jgi:hypothetical protein
VRKKKKVKRPEVHEVLRVVGALNVDRALTLRQLTRYTGLLREQLRLLASEGAINTYTYDLKRTGQSVVTHRLEVAVLRGSRFPDKRLLPHRLGLAETRRALGPLLPRWQYLVYAPRDEWRRWELFDAMAWGHDGRGVLVEYDAGTHTWSRITKKVEAGRRLQMRQLWATPSPTRAYKLDAIHPGVEVWIVDWVDGVARPLRGVSMLPARSGG